MIVRSKTTVKDIQLTVNGSILPKIAGLLVTSTSSDRRLLFHLRSYDKFKCDSQL